MSPPRWVARGRVVVADGRPVVMGIVNVTPDSFSDGGRFLDPAAALEHALRLEADGAAILDVGGESSRPGAESISVDDEIARVLPVVEALAGRVAVPISVDTTKPDVARRALDAGAAIINDIRGLADPEMLAVVAGSDAGAVLMHMAGDPRTMQVAPTYQDVVAEVQAALAALLRRATDAGIAPERIALDPGIGFGKTAEHNLDLLRHLGRFHDLGCALLIGTSRKRFLGGLTGREAGDRDPASVASALAAAATGASVVRVHDVRSTVDAFRVWEAQVGWPGLSA